MRRAAALIAVVLAGGIAAVALLDSGPGPATITGATALNAKAVVSLPRPGSADGAAAALPAPQPVGLPVQALVPTPTASKKPAKPKKPTNSPASPTAAPPTPGGPVSSAPPVPAPPKPQPSSSPTPSPTAPAGGGGGASCTKPSFTTSADFGSETLGSYTVANNMWNVGGGGITQSISACSSSSFFVNANVSEDGGGVKTYPNSHFNFNNAPAISSLKSVTSTFDASLPGDNGDFEDAYDIWLNGLAGAGGDEVMIWTDNHGETPAGSPMTSVTFNGASYTVWKGNNGPVSFVADSTVTSGTLNLLAFFQWLISKGFEPANSNLQQVDYGVEIASTNNTQETFNFSNFSVSSS
jgi:hypothetical protein